MYSLVENFRCNHDQGLQSFEQLVSYMDLVDTKVEKVISIFIREQEKKCANL